MAHHLNYNQANQGYSFFSVQKRAWHGLGKIVEQYPTSAEAIQYAGLGYHVEKRPLFTYDTENHIGGHDRDLIIPEIAVPGYFATIRTDTEQVLGVVGKDYEVVQNVDAFRFFDAIVGGGDGILYETAGALGNGERIFITAKLPGYIRVGKDDFLEQYLFLTTSHNGLGSITAAFTPIRICRNNTLNAALRNHSNAIRVTPYHIRWRTPETGAYLNGHQFPSWHRTARPVQQLVTNPYHRQRGQKTNTGCHGT